MNRVGFFPWIANLFLDFLTDFGEKTKIDLISQEEFWKLSDIKNKANDEGKNICYSNLET